MTPITGSLQGGGQRVRVEEGDVEMAAEVSGYRGRERRGTDEPEAGPGHVGGVFSTASRWNRPLLTDALILAQRNQLQTSDGKNREVTRVCCVKPIRLREFVTTNTHDAVFE